MNKKLTYFVWALLCLLFPFLASAQTNCNGYTTNTDWRNYAAPTNPPTIPLPPYQNINSFDWSTNFFTFYKNVGGTVTPYQVQSPFWENTSGLATQPNIDHFRNKFYHNGFYSNPTQAIASVDIWPEDGWELLYKDFGDAAMAYANNPSFGLYNRYTGIMRIFYYVEQMGNTASSTARISIRPKIGYNNNALLSFTETEIKALDAFERHLTSGLNYAQALTNFWLFIEIPVAFDPCVCRYPTQEVMDFKFEIVEQGTLVLEGNAAGFSTPMLYNNGVYTPVKSNIISSHVKKKTGTDYLQEANAYYKTLSDFKDKVNVMIGAQNSSGTDKTNAASEIDLFTNWMIFAKALPKVGAAIGVIDFLITGGKAKNTATKEPTPIGYETELKLKLNGAITEDINLSSLALRVPGASNTGAPNPIYNNPLGVFNLLESPPVEYAVYNRSFESAAIRNRTDARATSGFVFDVIPDPHDFSKKFDFFKDHKIREYRFLKSNLYNRLLNFIVNPSSQLQVEQIKGALLFKFTSLPDNIDTSNYYKYVVGPVEFGITRMERVGLGFVHRMRMLGYEIESWPDGTAKLKDITFRTSYANLGCLEDEANFFVWEYGGASYADEPDVWLKLDIQLKRSDSYALANPNQTQDIIMILKYGAKVTENSTLGLSYAANMFVNGGLDQMVSQRFGYEILPNGDFQPNSTSHEVFFSSDWVYSVPTAAYQWNAMTGWGIIRKHTMSPSPWGSNPINKRYGTLIVNNINAPLFIPPPAHPAGTTINAYNLYLHPDVLSFNTDLIINVGNHVYSSNNWSKVNTNVDWQQNTIVSYQVAPGQTIPFFGSSLQPLTVSSLGDAFEYISITDNMGVEIPSPTQMLPYIPGFNLTIDPIGTITMQPIISGPGIVNVNGYKLCSGSPQNFQATQANVQSFCNGSTYANNAVQKMDELEELSSEEVIFDDEKIKIYPNPNTGMFTLSFTATSFEQPVSLIVTDMAGKRIVTVFENQRYSAGSHKQNIVLDNVEAGIYICTLTIGENIYHEKVVIVK